MPIRRISTTDEHKYERYNLLTAASGGAVLGYAAKHFLPLGNGETLENLLNRFDETSKKSFKDTFCSLKKAASDENAKILEEGRRAMIKSSRPAALFMLIGSALCTTFAVLFNALKKNEREYIRKLQEKELSELSELA